MKNSVEFVIFCAMVGLVLLVELIGAVFGWSTSREFDGTVTKTYVDRGNTYFVISEDGADTPVVYENEDAWFFLKWNSGDILRDLNVGQRYHFKVYGWRVRVFSWFPNIVSATPLSQ